MSAPETPSTQEEIPPEQDVAWQERQREEGLADIFGFDFDAVETVDRSGLRALVNSALVSHRRLPMLDVVFDRTARLMTTSLRQLTDDNVEVALDDVTSTRFGDYLQTVRQPAVIGVARAAGLGDYCLVTADAALVYSIVDLLLGGRRGGDSLEIGERSFTAIELGLAQRVLASLTEDLGEAFEPITSGGFSLDRLETTPRFAAIAQEASVCALAKYRVRIEERGGRVSVLIPHAALDPVRRKLSQEFMGDTAGDDGAWRGHLAAEIAEAGVELSAVLAEKALTIRALQELKAGDTLSFRGAHDGAVALRSGDKTLARGRIGRAGEAVAVRLDGRVGAPARIGGGEA